MTISQQKYEQLALEHAHEQWELVCGRPRRKPEMTIEHDTPMWHLTTMLARQVDDREYLVGSNSGRLQVSTGSFYIPDVFVVPWALLRRLRTERPRQLAILDAPLPLVVEIWSPSTGGYDVETKLREYQLRGDAEIWRIHPYERTLTAWRRQPDGTYSETLYREGVVEPVALPGVRIELETLFD